MKFDVESQGSITGTWEIAGRDIIMIYDEALNFYFPHQEIRHSHSEKSEIISVWGYKPPEVLGFMKKGKGKIRMVKYE